VSMQVILGGQGRDRTGDLPLFRRTLVPTELPGRKAPPCLAAMATLTGLEPATSAVTGRRANQLRHRALLCDSIVRGAACTPYGIRTRATALKGRRPRPLDEGGLPNLSGVLATL
jgi:integrase